MSPRTRTRDYYDGVRASITWLHERAASMNDPHARTVLNSAAFSLGVAKPTPPAESGLGDGSGHGTEPRSQTRDEPNPHQRTT